MREQSSARANAGAPQVSVDGWSQRRARTAARSKEAGGEKFRTASGPYGWLWYQLEKLFTQRHNVIIFE